MAQKHRPDPAEVRALLQSAEKARADIQTFRRLPAGLAKKARVAVDELRAQRLDAQMRDTPIDVLAGNGLRIQALKDRGYTSIADVLAAGPNRLMRLQGVGARTAHTAHQRAERIRNEVWQSQRLRLTADSADAAMFRVLVLLYRYRILQEGEVRLGAGLDALSRALPDLIAEATPAKSRLRLAFAGSERRRRAMDAVESLRARTRASAIVEARRVSARVQGQLSRTAVLGDFTEHNADYFALLDALVPGVLGDEGKADLPAELVRDVERHSLDLSLVTGQLRRYQVFGARYALERRRVLIGDEMGVGKTLQALAVAAHLQSQSHGRVLVVCPAAVMINWQREVAGMTRLKAVVLHGTDRGYEAQRWIRRGGVAITTFDTLKTLGFNSGLPLRLLIVDEAHYIKNPETQRTKAVRSVAAGAEHVMFLSGTPLENRLEEFTNLTRMLQPEVARRLNWSSVAAGPSAFRRAAAPVYLRRNQEDVLSELPELVEVAEWERFTPADERAYRAAVISGNAQRMRRAAFEAGQSAKVARLKEICAEANANGRKVLVFSNFRDVLQRVHRELGEASAGVIDGSVTPARRQQLVDDFTRSRTHGVLVAQVQAGGVGLNIQAASVVVLCEPQYKPSTEDQAIKRAHRMGQLGTVQVHRLLVADSVDQRILEILGQKRLLFDQFVRESYVAQTQAEARNGSDVAMDRLVVSAERRRLGLAG